MTHSSSSLQRTRRHRRTFPHLFDLEQTFAAADGFGAVPRLQDESFLGAERAADLAGEPGRLVCVAELGEAGVAAEPVNLTVHGHRERTLKEEEENCSCGQFFSQPEVQIFPKTSFVQFCDLKPTNKIKSEENYR